MGKRFRLAGKCAAFTVIMWFCVMSVYRVLVPKFFYDTTWPTTSTYLGFYEMEKNTVDVLFFGSSHAVSFFLPQELYDGYGIRSYNLGCEQQNLVTSYFWLKEALRYQKPGVVVLDCYMLFPYNPQEPLNTAESCTRKALDFMRWSAVKREAVRDICRLDENQSLLSYYLPNIRYHTRWTGLSENDFTFSRMAGRYELMGYAPLGWHGGREDFQPFAAAASAGMADMVPLMREYLEHITALCRQEGIRLVLAKTPSTAGNAAKYNTVKAYADEHGLDYWDFNEKRLYRSTGLRFQTDNADDGHGSLWGAQKVSRQTGKMLSQQYGTGGHTDRQWEDTKGYYQAVCKDCELAHETEIDDYLEALQDERYSIFISAKEECTAYLKDSSLEKLRALGLRAELEGAYGCSYLAAVCGGKTVEKSGYEELEAEGTVRDGLAAYRMKSAGAGCGSCSSIVIDGAERSKNSRGLNIAVYNHETKKLVDAVCFDTSAQENPAVR